MYSSIIKPEIEHAMEGINTTILLYGVTGSGKTHTVFGNLGWRDPANCSDNENGIVYFCFKKIMENAGCEFSMIYVEIYNEQVKDLLGSEDNLALNDSPTGEVVIQGVQSRPIATFENIIQNIKEGNLRRKVARTCANAFSSRSHAVLQFNIVRKTPNGNLTSKLSFIDLAGSERVETTQNKGT